MRVKITKRVVESQPSHARDVFLWDTELPGFGLKITPRGSRIYLFQYSRWGSDRRITIGRHGIDITADEARRKSLGLRGLVARGHDPAAELTAARASPSIAEFANRYLEEHALLNKKKRSIEEDVRNLSRHVLPILGQLKLADIARHDIVRFHQCLKQTPVAANRCLALLCSTLNLAEKWGMRPDGSNPTKHVAKYREKKVERFLSDGELARLGSVLKDAETEGEHPSIIAAIRLLILTGCRRNEILTLRWENVDLKAKCLMLPDSKTGAKVVPLGAPAVDVLSSLVPIPGNPFVLPGQVAGKHYVALEKAWRKVRARADISDVRLHDLRHSFASVGAGLNESLLLIGSLLGHRSTATTARYAHFSNNPRLAAADRISQRIAKVKTGAGDSDRPRLAIAR